ncbi:MAG: hypothetical protein DRN78_06645 [Thermoproteota archaeon]|nr:hypothetical protein [Candidatus Korarchaeota archaeon]RLG39499.1 MAG: hypothetical protein DRN78_06645 [Candidatus Korarchaeota archaeon]
MEFEGIGEILKSLLALGEFQTFDLLSGVSSWEPKLASLIDGLKILYLLGKGAVPIEVEINGERKEIKALLVSDLPRSGLLRGKLIKAPNELESLIGQEVFFLPLPDPPTLEEIRSVIDELRENPTALNPTLLKSIGEVI